MSTINVLHLTNNFGDSSIDRIVLRLSNSIELEDVSWHVGGFDGPGEMLEEFSQQGVKVVSFSKEELNTLVAVRQYILLNDIRIVHTHTPRTIFIASFALIGINSIEHISTKHLLNRSGDRKWGAIYTLLDRLSLYFPDRLISVSQRMYEQIIRQPGLKKKRVTVIRNSIPYEQFYAPEQRASCREELGLSSDSIVLGFAGRIKRVKRIDLLLDVFLQICKLHSNARLVIAGEGCEKSRLESYASVLGISNKVIWTGFRKDIPRILAAIDIYVQVSCNEGLSLSILEAMAAGKPVVASDTGGNSEVVKDGVTGFLTKNCSADDAVRAISNLIEHPELRKRLSIAGSDFARTNFSFELMVSGYRNLYKTVISEIAI